MKVHLSHGSPACFKTRLGCRSAQQVYAAKATDAKASADDGEAGTEQQQHDNEGQEDAYSAAFAESQHPEDKDGYSLGDGAWVYSDYSL